MTRVLVPLDLLDGWPNLSLLDVLARSFITAIVLGGWSPGAPPWEAASRFDAALREAKMYWPPHELAWGTLRPSVFSTLDQLERLGVCRIVDREGGCLVVERAAVAA